MPTIGFGITSLICVTMILAEEDTCWERVLLIRNITINSKESKVGDFEGRTKLKLMRR